jgi:ABC-type glutathione transport system ATPase component
MPMLDIEGLSVTFGSGANRVRAVRQVNLQIPRGAIHGLIGESGCGKTMTGMSLLGLLPEGARIEAGRFRFDGMELRDVAASLRGRRIALISQDPAAALNPVLSIGRQIDDVLRSHRSAPRHERRSEAV